MTNINNRPCKECLHYDPIIVGDKKKTRRGWCAVKSEYPAVEPEGRFFPPGVRRVPAGEQAKPFIVIGDDVVGQCREFRAKNPR
jgi:hypothetical protein